MTASKALDLESDIGRADVLRLMMTLLLWSTPQDADFVSTSDDAVYLIPQPAKPSEHVVATVEEVLHDSVCVRGPATRVCR